ncbi:MAG: 6,7-dimethyl-8-ribityllumazine synthase [Endomicrobia bacterium]|nr:6,7-dimethyl-8-ribityllumazine synthase [Endomicrobiia bacterium]MCX7940600.1 6,7-dimethyl-8-ribityllumazine synthase [Endomicrobiia bacterium]MDW8055330.1 6,7-dimethyl-8-ribityllumazine synthase [Elusimicrobiota bacterium]
MCAKIYQGKLTGKDKKICIVVSRFNDFVTKHMLDGAIDVLVRHEVKEEDIDVVWVPGSFEIPFMCKRAAKTKKYDGIIALGAIIKGDTSHNEYISTEVTKGIAQVMLETDVPIAYGIITPDSIEQAIERAGTKLGNKGAQAAMTLLEMINIKL